MRCVAWPLTLLAVAATGCTMCPDPFDYSGPVPNGSAPQNDFCARSNGILPLNVTATPWPPIVEGDYDAGEANEAVAAYPAAVVVADYVDEPKHPDSATAKYPSDRSPKSTATLSPGSVQATNHQE